MDHLITPALVYHQHNWTLIERRDHTLDRSFNFRLDFEHFQHFEYDLLLKSPRTNFTHHINYTKVSEFNHIVRAHALLHSNTPTLDLIYNGKLNISQNKCAVTSFKHCVHFLFTVSIKFKNKMSSLQLCKIFKSL